MYRYLHLLIGFLYFAVAAFFQSEMISSMAVAMTLCMVHWWIFQPIPIYITALLPIILGPLFGLVNEQELALSYGNKMVFLFLGGFLLALGIEKWKLHRFLAEYIIHLFGNTPPRILAGFMVATAMLSMWISNTATALMMLPMAMSVIHVIPRFRLKKRFAIALLLSIAFAANIGGTATLIGTPPNVQMAGILEQQFATEITFWEWFKIGFPFMALLLTATFGVLYVLFLRKINFTIPTQERRSINGAQLRVLLLFLFVVFLWIINGPILKSLGLPINDTIIALFGGLLLFIVPAKGNQPILIWQDTVNLPWGILFLFGGGLALAKILSNGNVLAFLVQSMGGLSESPIILILFLFFALALFATELMSNLALVSLLVPVLGEFALANDLPLVIMAAGVALSASCAFMLPVATPPNAIVFASNLIPMKVMIKVGFVLNMITLLLTTVLMYAKVA